MRRVDVEDWNKICGLTWFLTGNTNRTAMLAWRPNEQEENTFQIGTYVNDRRGRVRWHNRVTVAAWETVYFQIIWMSDKVLFKLQPPGEPEPLFFYEELKQPPWWFKFYREIGPWFGGNRAAHKNMKMELEKT